MVDHRRTRSFARGFLKAVEASVDATRGAGNVIAPASAVHLAGKSGHTVRVAVSTSQRMQIAISALQEQMKEEKGGAKEALQLAVVQLQELNACYQSIERKLDLLLEERRAEKQRARFGATVNFNLINFDVLSLTNVVDAWNNAVSALRCTVLNVSVKRKAIDALKSVHNWLRRVMKEEQLGLADNRLDHVFDFPVKPVAVTWSLQTGAYVGNGGDVRKRPQAKRVRKHIEYVPIIRKER